MVVAGDDVDHYGRHPKAASDVGAYQRVGTFDLVSDGLAQIVQQAAQLGGTNVRAQLCCQDTSQM